MRTLLFLDVDKDNVGDMISQQLDQLNHKDPNQSFVQYWTLTQQTSDVIECALDSSKSILNMAVPARPELFKTLFPYVAQHQLFPNVLLTDDAGKNDEIVALAMALNFLI